MSAAPRMGARSSPRVAENRMRNTARPHLTVLVEGGSDQRFWQIFFVYLLPKGTVDYSIQPADPPGRAGVMAMLDRARNHKDTLMVGIVDADLDRVKGVLQPQADVFYSDAHDLETTLLTLPALEKLLNLNIAKPTLDKAEERWKSTFRERLFQHAEGAGRLRWLNERNTLGLVFRKQQKNGLVYVDHCKGVSSDWTPSLSAFLNEVINFSNQMTLKSQVDPLVRQCQSLPAATLEQLCNGHDLIGFLRAGLYALTNNKLALETLTHQLFAAVERVWLEETKLWKALDAYCTTLRNRPRHAPTS